ncbi:hypothetical protein Tco_1513278, partial [Tanacetum coccineum]
KGIELLSDAAQFEIEIQKALKASRRESKFQHQIGGSSEGDGLRPEGSTDEEQYLLAYKDEKPKEILWKSTNEDESDNDDEEESNDDNDNEEEEQDEDPSAGSNQGKKTEKRKFNESESSKKTSTAKESSKGKSLAKTSKSSKSITVEEPVEDLVFEKASYDVEKTIDDKMDIVDVPQVDTDPKLTKKD